MKTHLLRLSSLVPLTSMTLFLLSAAPQAAAQAPSKPVTASADIPQQISDLRKKTAKLQEQVAANRQKIEGLRKARAAGTALPVSGINPVSSATPAEIAQRSAAAQRKLVEAQEKAVVLRANADESRKKVDVAFANLNEKFTPEMQRAAAQTTIRSREPRYRALFESLKLDPAASDLAILIVHQRETKLAEFRIPFFQKGMAGAAEYQQGSKAARETAEAQLRIVLGPAHFNELTKLEAQIAGELKARTEELMRNRPKN